MTYRRYWGSIGLLLTLMRGAVRTAAYFAASYLLCSGPAFAGDFTLNTSDSGSYGIHVTSYSEIPFKTVIRQKFDYSCGSAALATLLKFHYGFATDEIRVFKSMYEAGDQPRIRKLGFSLLDMKKYLASVGYFADGYRLTLSELAKASAPAIALVQIGSYKHFVVVKGVVGQFVLIGDPALGLREMPKADFEKIWNGVLFLIHDVPEASQSAKFNNPDEWKRWADTHPLSAAIINAPLTPLLRDLRVIYQVEPNQTLPSPFQP